MGCNGDEADARFAAWLLRAFAAAMGAVLLIGFF